MERNATIFDLPILPYCNGPDVADEYKKDRDGSISEETLRAFTTKWAALWKLKTQENDREMTPEEEALVLGTYNPENVLKCLEALHLPDGKCEHVGNGPSCCGMHIMLPPALMIVSLISMEYGLPFNPAFIQLSMALHPLIADKIGVLF